MSVRWSDKYIGVPYDFGKCDLKTGTDCLRLTELIYRQEKNYKVSLGGDPVTDDWYVRNPERLIKQAIKHGSVIADPKKLKEFDLVTFKFKGRVRHMGVMIDEYGHFVHQMIKMNSKLDDLAKRHWAQSFYCGIRVNFDKQVDE